MFAPLGSGVGEHVCKRERPHVGLAGNGEAPGQSPPRQGPLLLALAALAVIVTRMTTDATPPVNLASMPRAEFAFPGPLRDQLVAAILNGSKTSTTGLLVDYELEGEPLPKVGSRSVVIDSDDRPVAVIEITGVRVVPLAQVDLAHVVDEGEGDTSVAEWRSAHERFWHSEEMRAALEDPEFTVDDTTLAVLERFRLVTDLHLAD